MQALSVSPSVGGLFLVPRLDFKVGWNCPASTCERRGRRRRGLVDTAFHGKRFSLLMVCANSRRKVRYLSSSFGLGTGFLSHRSKLQHVVFFEPMRGSLGSSFTLAWASEEKSVESEFQRIESSSDDEVSGKLEVDDADCHRLERLENTEGSGCQEETEKSDQGSEGKLGKEERSVTIDVRELAGTLQFAKTADDVEEVLKDKANLPLQVYSSMIRGYGWDKKLEPALALVEWLKRKKKETGGQIGPNHFIYNSLLGTIRQCGQYGKAEEIMSEMTREGILPNVVTYNTLMIILIEEGQAARALDILEEMRTKGVAPSGASYSTALLAYQKLEDANRALKLFVELSEKHQKGELGRDSDENWDKELAVLEDFTIRICYIVMRRWLAKHENTGTKVLKLLVDMDKAGLSPSRAEYERLVWACTKEEHYSVAKELYARIRERYSDISLSVCNHVIMLMGKAKKWWAALEIYEDLLDKGPEPNNLSYELILSNFTILLNAAKKRGIWRWGVKLLNKMEEKGLKPGSRGWNAVLLACSKASETSAAVEVFRRMVDHGEKPTDISYGALLSALKKGKLYGEAVRVWEHMLKIGIQPNVYFYTIMASVFSGMGNFRMVDTIIQEMTSSGIEPTIVTYNAIISECAQNSMSSTAYEWFHRMKVQNISPDEITYAMLIQGLAKDGKPKLACELYSRAQNEGLNLPSKAYDAVVRSLHKQKATVNISDLGPRPSDIK